jgi:hypothetical protein
MNKKSVVVLGEREIGRNLQRVIDEMGMDLKAFAELIGKKPNHVSNFINNTNNCKASNLLQEIVLIGINPKWYLTGIGDVRMGETPTQCISKRDAEIASLVRRLYRVLREEEKDEAPDKTGAF